MRLFVFLIVVIVLYSCKDKVQSTSKEFSKVEVNVLLQDSLLDVRALEIFGNEYVYFATSTGRIGAGFFEENAEVRIIDYGQWIQLKFDSIRPNFRSLAGTIESGFVMSIGTPALLFKSGAEEDKLVYKEDHPKAFYDSMDFWNDREGIAIGDPTDQCMSIIITRDGGNTWNKLSCENLPMAKDGEAAFAASDTNIAIVGDHTWVATGGKASRVMYSPDKGRTWEVYDTPIVQGKETTGIYSVDFYDELHGFAIGGDYTNPNDNQANKILTNDGGKTWEVVGAGEAPGYRSCAQYIPDRKGKEIVALGFKGIDYSKDGGYSWTHLSDEGFYTIRFLNDSVAYAAGKGRIAKLTFKE